ncbi:MAG: hypothetical protein FRX49_05515 [Trebouxia sp. A1-2]|nr:MAG: hypothetical protein FRX49_05515 [Trebouxia sp. A1-2]
MPAIVVFAAVTPNGLCHCCVSGDLLCAVGELLLGLEARDAVKGSEALLWPEKPRRAPMRDPGKKGKADWLPPCAEKAIMGSKHRKAPQQHTDTTHAAVAKLKHQGTSAAGSIKEAGIDLAVTGQPGEQPCPLLQRERQDLHDLNARHVPSLLHCLRALNPIYSVNQTQKLSVDLFFILGVIQHTDAVDLQLQPSEKGRSSTASTGSWKAMVNESPSVTTSKGSAQSIAALDSTWLEDSSLHEKGQIRNFDVLPVAYHTETDSHHHEEKP